MEKCYLFWTYQLPGGTCAQWFSGTATTLAVIVALGAHFYAALRQRKSEAREDAAEVAGVSMILRTLLNEAEANVTLFSDGCKIVTLWGVEYTLSNRFGATGATRLSQLDQRQADVLIRSGQLKLAEAIDTLIGKTNLSNLGIEDYNKIRSDLSVELDKYPGAAPDETLDESSEEGRRFKKKIRILSKSAEEFINSTREQYKEVLSVIKSFNSFCSGIENLNPYQIDVAWHSARLEKVQPSGTVSGAPQ